MGRRGAVELGLALALAPRLALAQTEPTRERPREGDLLVAVGAPTPEPLSPDNVSPADKPMMAWPMDPESQTVRSGSRLNKVLLLRLDPEGFDPETREHSFEGIVAYSAVCTHTGCDVTSWHRRQLRGYPCHFSLYDPRKAPRWSAARRRAVCRRFR
jgi:hypothetical protein